MSKIVDRIGQLICSLPKKDIKVARRLLENREFDELEGLIASVILDVNRNLKSSNPKEEYKNISIDDLEDLQSIVTEYNEEQYYDVQYDASNTDDRYYSMCRDSEY